MSRLYLYPYSMRPAPSLLRSIERSHVFIGVVLRRRGTADFSSPVRRGCLPLYLVCLVSWPLSTTVTAIATYCTVSQLEDSGPHTSPAEQQSLLKSYLRQLIERSVYYRSRAREGQRIFPLLYGVAALHTCLVSWRLDTTETARST